MYNWQHEQWPNFDYDASIVADALRAFEAQVSLLMSRVAELPEEEIRHYLLSVLVEEAATTSSIEGEIISREELMSSILNNLNLGGQVSTRDRRANAVARLITLNRETFAEPLTETAVKYWHQLLLSGDEKLQVVGDYRQSDQPMRIVSGHVYRQVIHFEAPPSARVPGEMAKLIAFCNQPLRDQRDAVLQAGVAHIWFESIHPFEDGNGRLGRAIIEKLLSQRLGAFVPFSISHSIEQERKAYYAALKASQSGLNITTWLNYFCDVLLQAIDYANELVEFSIKKYRYFQKFDPLLGHPERKAINKMFAAGPTGFQGGMTARKYGSINRVSRATATRTLQHLARIGALTQHGAGRSTHYLLPQA